MVLSRKLAPEQAGTCLENGWMQVERIERWAAIDEVADAGGGAAGFDVVGGCVVYGCVIGGT